jgi:hypothetical protein
MPVNTYTRENAILALRVGGGGTLTENTKVLGSLLAGTAGPMDPQPAIADLATDASGTEISVAVNKLIAALVLAGFVTAA